MINMDTSNFRPELHVAQQSRRDKLRIQNDSSSSLNNLGSFTNNAEQISDLRPRNICYDSTGLCAEMFDFVSNSQAFMAHKDGLMVDQEPEKWAGEASFGNFSQATFNSSAAVNCDFSTWKSIGSQTSRDWVSNQSPNIVGDSLSGPSSKIDRSTHVSTLDVKHYLGYQELNSSSEISNPNGQKQFGDMHCSSSFYTNGMHGAASSSSNVQSFCQEISTVRQKSFEESSHVPWVVGGGELVLLPAYADQLRLKSTTDLISRPADGGQLSSELEYAASKNAEIGRRSTVANDKSITQVLSLSLSSIPSPNLSSTQVSEGHASSDLHSANDNNVRDFGSWKPEYLASNFKLSSTGTTNVIGSTRQETMGIPTVITHRNPGPLGPFTGYATILKCSKFLRPAEQLLDELCSVARPMHVEICAVDNILDEVRISYDVVSVAEHGVKRMAGDSSSSSFTFNCSNEKSWELGGTSSASDSYQPENLQKKAKLLYMQDEVCKRYRQYHQQMQMVFSSFETVAGLSAATPCISLALKMVSKHFRCLKNAITDQLKSIRNALGEDLSSPTAGMGSSKGHDASALMLKFFDQSFQKQKGGAHQGIIESQHVWRPQRGLPERAVLILRAWLFDHFLHPYPTDTDKHMLASQTGLTRNQVSNWFINARVRVWKPMVEEIHMLETKGVAEETGSNAGKTDEKLATEGYDQSNNGQSLNRLLVNAVSDKQLVECSMIIPPECTVNRSNSSMWNEEKRSRVEHHIPETMDGSLMSFVPSHDGGNDTGGLGSVSLTLGLRQSAENAQQDHQLRQYFRCQNIQDFIG